MEGKHLWPDNPSDHAESEIISNPGQLTAGEDFYSGSQIIGMFSIFVDRD